MKRIPKFCQCCGFPLVKNGHKKLKYREELQQWLCKKCGAEPTDNDFKGMWYPRKLVILAVDLFTIGVVPGRIVEVIYEQYEIWISESIIYVWVRRFSRNIPEYEFDNLSKMLHDDDTQIKGKKKGHRFHFWALKCPKTKIMKVHVSRNKSEEDVKRHFRKAKHNFKPSYTPGSIRTDSFPGYSCSINAVWNHDVKNDRFESFKNHSNNEIENAFREKRKFHRLETDEGMEGFTALWEYRYNFIRIHDTIKKTPAEAAGLEKGFWEEIIKIFDMFVMLMLERITIAFDKNDKLGVSSRDKL